MEIAKGWFSFVELKLKNDLFVGNGFVIAVPFLVAFQVSNFEP